MTLAEMEALFLKHKSERYQFDRVKEPRSARLDLHVMIMLDAIVPFVPPVFPSHPNARSSAPYADDLLNNADEDEVVFCIDPEDLATRATEDQLVDMIRGGLDYRASDGALFLFI